MVVPSKFPSGVTPNQSVTASATSSTAVTSLWSTPASTAAATWSGVHT